MRTSATRFTLNPGQFTTTFCPPTSSGPSSQPEPRRVHPSSAPSSRTSCSPTRSPRPGQGAERAARSDARTAVTIGEKSYPLPDPFVVMATQNPIEQEGRIRSQGTNRPFHVDGQSGHHRPKSARSLDRMTGPLSVKAETVVTPQSSWRRAKSCATCTSTIASKTTSWKWCSPGGAGECENERALRAHRIRRVAARRSLSRSPRAPTLPPSPRLRDAEDVKAVGPDVLRHRMVLSHKRRPKK